MFMRYRGGGVGHTSTREATNKFLLDRDRLDMTDGPGEESDGIDIDSDVEEGDRLLADVGRVSGGDNTDGGAGDGDGIGDGEEDNYRDYGYENHVDDDENSEEDQDITDDL